MDLSVGLLYVCIGSKENEMLCGVTRMDNIRNWSVNKFNRSASDIWMNHVNEDMLIREVNAEMTVDSVVEKEDILCRPHLEGQGQEQEDC